MALHPQVLESVKTVMAQAGFVEDSAHDAYGRVDELSHNGVYTVHGAWKKDADSAAGTPAQSAHLEQNSVDDENGGSEVFPPVLVLSNDNGGSTVINLHDMEALASALSGQISF